MTRNIPRWNGSSRARSRPPQYPLRATRPDGLGLESPATMTSALRMRLSAHRQSRTNPKAPPRQRFPRPAAHRMRSSPLRQGSASPRTLLRKLRLGVSSRPPLGSLFRRDHHAGLRVPRPADTPTEPSPSPDLQHTPPPHRLQSTGAAIPRRATLRGKANPRPQAARPRARARSPAAPQGKGLPISHPRSSPPACRPRTLLAASASPPRLVQRRADPAPHLLVAPPIRTDRRAAIVPLLRRGPFPVGSERLRTEKGRLVAQLFRAYRGAASAPLLSRGPFPVGSERLRTEKDRPVARFTRTFRRAAFRAPCTRRMLVAPPIRTGRRAASVHLPCRGPFPAGS